MKHQISLNICTVENGWIVFVNSDSTRGLGYALPSYVFNDARELANAVHELLCCGTLATPAFTGSGLPGDPVTATKSISEMIDDFGKSHIKRL